MVNGALIFLVLITFTFGAPINHPVNNAYANLHTADLFRITQISNNFTVIDYQSPNQIYVFMDYKEKINKDLLFCPRTFDNPFMGYFGRNTKREHVMCKEILYETTFKCVVTNLRAECKSLQSFDSILTKTTTLKTKAEDSEQNTKTDETSTSVFSVKTSNQESNNGEIYGIIIIIFAVIFALLAIFFVTMKKRENKVIYFPAFSKNDLNNRYSKTPIRTESIQNHALIFGKKRTCSF